MKLRTTINLLVVLLFLSIFAGKSVVAKVNSPETEVIDQEIKYMLVINRVKNRDLFPSFYDAFTRNQSFWPAILPTDISDSEYTKEIRFNSRECLNSEKSICYGDVYRGEKLIAQNRTSLLVLKSEIFVSTSRLRSMLTEFYLNFSWSHAIYIDTKDDRISSLTLSFRSPSNPIDNQVWSGWLIWTYDSLGVATRFDLITWRMDENLVSNYDPMTNSDKSDLTAYYELIFETPRVFNEGLAFIVIFAGGIASVMISPFVTIAFISRRSTKNYSLNRNQIIPENQQLLISSGGGLIKFLSGSLIIGIFCLFQFIFPSNTASILVSILLSGFLWFGIYIILKTIIEKMSNATVQVIPIGITSIVSIVIGLYGFFDLQPKIGLFINPEMFESIVIVNSLFYSTTLGVFTGLILIYEALYKTTWSFNAKSRSFIIKRESIFVTMVERISEDNIKKITLEIKEKRNQYGMWKAAKLKLHTKSNFSSKEFEWNLQNKKSYLSLFGLREILRKHELISLADSDSLINEITSSSEFVHQKTDNWEKIVKKYPELKKKELDVASLEEGLRKAGIQIQPHGNNRICIKFENYRSFVTKGLVSNLGVLGIISLIMTYFSIKFILEDFIAGFATLGVIKVYFGAISIVISIFVQYQFIRILLRTVSLISIRSVTLTLSAEEFIIELRNKNLIIENFPIIFLMKLTTKRDLFIGGKMCLNRNYNHIPIFHLSNRGLMQNLVTYISYFIQKNSFKPTIPFE